LTCCVSLNITPITAGNLTVDPTAVGAGGVVSPSGQRYEYDEENRLRAVRRTGDDLLLAEYAYDALGRRVETVEHVDSATGLPLPAPCRTRHIHAGIETIEEYDVCEDAGGVETATLLREFVWGDGNRFPEPIALIDHTDAGEAPAGTPEVLHTLRDVLGSVVALANATGAVVERYTYDPYGRTYMERWDAAANGGLGGWVETEVSAFGNPFGWTGQRYDAGVGLYAFRFRTYSPALGRWVQRDPLGYVDGVNLYQYVTGNPLYWIDPFGLADVPWWVRWTDKVLGGDWETEAGRVEVILICCEVAQIPADVATLGITKPLKVGGRRVAQKGLKEGVEALEKKALREAAEKFAKKGRFTTKPKRIRQGSGNSGPHTGIVNKRAKRRQIRRERLGRERAGQNPKTRKQKSGKKKGGPAGADRGGCDAEEAHRRVKEGTGGGQRPPRGR